MEPISKEILEQHIPACIDSSGNVHEKMKRFLQDASTHIVTDYIGPTTMLAIESGSLDFKDRIIKAICLDAFLVAIPFLDLILTPNGFAVASTNQVAPASKERVERLMITTKNQRDDVLEGIMESIYSTTSLLTSWISDGISDKRINSIVWQSKTLIAHFGFREAHYSDLAEIQPKLNLAACSLFPYISKNYWEELVLKTKSNSLNNNDRYIVTELTTILGMLCITNADWIILKDNLNRIVEYLEVNIQQYPSYQSSPEYSLKHSQRYENKQEDNTFFFG